MTAVSFDRRGRRLRFTARHATVLDVRYVAPSIVRIRVTGSDLSDMVSEGPTDHVRVFVPDPATGELVAPAAIGPDVDGIVRPDRPSHGRDLTPMTIERVNEHTVLSLDVALHPEPGPLGDWAFGAVPGAEIVIVGPRGTKSVVQDARCILLIADATALPSCARWAREVPPATAVEVVVLSGAGSEGAAAYLAEQSGRSDLQVTPVHSIAELMHTVRARGVDGTTYVSAAGEAGAMAEVRRWLRRELELPRAQYTVSGYWKRGVSAFDHHAPLDPSDPDD